MAELHLVVGVAVLVSNFVVGLWGLGAWALDRPSVGFWYALRVAQGTVVAQVALGAILLLMGREPSDPWHYMYGAAPLLVNLFAEAMRVGAAQREIPEGVAIDTLSAGEQRGIALRIVRRETLVMALAALLIVAFAFRAAQVSGEMF